MTSAKYKVFKAALRLIPFKRLLSMDPDKMIALARKANSQKGRGFQIPDDKDFTYEDLSISQEGKDWHCLRMRPRASKSHKAMLFLFGGGMVTAAEMSDIRPAMRMGKEADREVFFPFYPLCTDYSLMVSAEMVYKCYKEILKEYRPEDVCIVGCSSGASLALVVAHLINEKDDLTPMPEKMILLSPGDLVDTPDWWARVRQIEKKDILMTSKFLSNVAEIMSHGEKLPKWAVNPTSRSFENFPSSCFWFGSDEVLAASIPNYEEVCRKAGVKYSMTVGQGMCHCYPVIPGPSFPEKEEAIEEIIRQINL